MRPTEKDIEELLKKSHYLEVINGFATQLLEASKVDDILWSIAKHAIAKLGYVDCVVYLYDKEKNELQQRAAHGPKNPIDFDINNPIRLKVGEGIVGHVALTGKAEIISNTTIDKRYKVDDIERLSEITVPILSEGKVIGVIDSEHPEPDYFTDQDLQILTTIAAMASSKIVESQIQETLKNHKKELERRVEKQTFEIQSTLEKLQLSHDFIIKTNSDNERLLKELKDSISYAKTIQKAIFPSYSIIQRYFPEFFIYYQPKDIVAGDFYWFEKPISRTLPRNSESNTTNSRSNETLLFAVADCTGHGVPGAMISVMCHNALNRSVHEMGLTEPGEILNNTRKLILQEFRNSGQELKDGMDIGLCALRENYLEFAGANNSLWLIRDDELIEIKGDRQPVGNFITSNEFLTHSIEVQKGDIIYLFSDGYRDQFGGSSDRRYKTETFRQFILSIHALPMSEQKERLENEFIDWKGKLDQVDDVCVFALKI